MTDFNGSLSYSDKMTEMPGGFKIITLWYYGVSNRLIIPWTT